MSEARAKNSTFDDEKNTKLHFAAARGRLEEVKKLVEEGHKVDPENYMGWTPLMMAARNGFLEVAMFLIDKRADATKKNGYGVSVFLMAVASGNVELCRGILNHLLCGGVSRQNIESVMSPISAAILFNHDELVDFLLSKQFSVNAQSQHLKLSPYMYTHLTNNKKIRELLVSQGALKDLVAVNGKTAKNLTSVKKIVIPVCVEPTPVEQENSNKSAAEANKTANQQENVTVQEPLPQQQHNMHPQHQQQLVTQQQQQPMQQVMTQDMLMTHAAAQPMLMPQQPHYQPQHLYPHPHQLPYAVYTTSPHQLPQQQQFVSPSPSFINISSGQYIRRSSNVSTPVYLTSPNLSGLECPPQVFFPHDGSPMHYVPSTPTYIDCQPTFPYQMQPTYCVSPHPALNMGFNGSSMFFPATPSPVPTEMQQFTYDN